MNLTERLRRPTTLMAAGVFLLALVVYGVTMPPTLSFWDCGEYIATSHILGIPHSPGTPTYVLMGRTFDLLLSPFTNTAVALNVMSAFFSALAVMFVYLIVLNVARRNDADGGWLAHAGGLTGAVFLMLSETFWNNAIEAEVYGLSAFIISFLTWLALKWYDQREKRSSDTVLFLIIYLLGLGVGFHMGSLLVYPGIFLMILLATGRRFGLIDLLGVSLVLLLFIISTTVKDNFVVLGLLAVIVVLGVVRSAQGRHVISISLGLFLLGVSVHIYMLIRAGLDPAINQWEPESFDVLMSVLRREQYPPIDPLVRRAELGWQVNYYYDFLLRQFTWLDVKDPLWVRLSVFAVPGFLAFLGAAHSLWRTPKIAVMLVANYFINGEILNLYLNFTDHEVRERDYFFFAGFLFFALFIGLGAAALARYLAGPLGRRLSELKESPPPIRLSMPSKLVAVLLLVIALAPLYVPGHAKWFEHDRSDNTMAREYAWNMIAGLDRDAIIFTNGDNDTFPVWYLQIVEKFRPDVTVVNLSLANLPWYIKQLTRFEPVLELDMTGAEIDSLGRATRFVGRDELIGRWGGRWGRNFESTLQGLTVLDKTGMVVTRSGSPEREAGGKIGQAQAERLMQLLIEQREAGLLLTGRTRGDGAEFEVVEPMTTVDSRVLTQYTRLSMAQLPPEAQPRNLALMFDRLGALSDAGIIVTRTATEALTQACVGALGDYELARMDRIQAALTAAGYPLTGRVMPDGGSYELSDSPTPALRRDLESAAARSGITDLDVYLRFLATLSAQGIDFGSLPDRAVGNVSTYFGQVAAQEMFDDFLALQDATVYLSGWVSRDRSRVGVGQVYKDRIIERIIEANAGRRPVFFAATIPFSNIWIEHMGRLKMEGLAYRLVDERSPDGYTSVDPERLLANVFGVYDFSALLGGDSEAGRDLFRELNGLPADAEPGEIDALLHDGDWRVDDVWRAYGDFRTDLHYSPNGRNLKGNYPLGLLRASQVFLNRTRSMDVDDPEYLRILGKIESCLELTLRLQDEAVGSDQIAYFYPIVLASRGRAEDAIAYVDEVAPRLPMQQSWEVMEQLAMNLSSSDDAPLAAAWLERRIDEAPEDPAHYYLAFKVQRSLADLEGCRGIHDRWRARFGSDEPEMAAAIAEMEARSAVPPELMAPALDVD